MSCVDVYEDEICISVQTVHLSAQKSLTAVKTEIKIDSHADTCVAGDLCLVVHDHSSQSGIEACLHSQYQSSLYRT